VAGNRPPLRELGWGNLREACTADQRMEGKSASIPQLPISVNLSAKQFLQANLVDDTGSYCMNSRGLRKPEARITKHRHGGSAAA